MASGHTDYTFRQAGPDVLQREQNNTVKLEVWRDGALVAPTSGTLTLFDPGGEKLIDAQAVTISSSIATYTITSATLPSTVDVGRLYMLRWKLTISGQAFEVQRACTVARFPMVLPVTDNDLVDGEYPDLVEQLGDYGANLQKFLDSAKRDVLRELEQKGQWPDIITSPSDLYEPIRQLAYAKVFRFLFNTNDSDRSQILMTLHQDKYEKVLRELTARFDRDDDGLPDSTSRDAVVRSVHPGGAPRRYARKDPRW
jgi:hypothetical protein